VEWGESRLHKIWETDTLTANRRDQPNKKATIVSFEKCSCVHCGQHIEYPSEGTGQTIQCPTCNEPVFLTPLNQPTTIGLVFVPAAPPRHQKQTKTRLGNLTPLTIRKSTQRGETPLHRAAKQGRFSEIPEHLLELELFMAKDYRGETPLHFAAKHGYFNQVPPEFFTRETLKACDDAGNTPLHTAACYGHADQIPTNLLTAEFLSIPTKIRYAGEFHDGDTLLHVLAAKQQLGIIPKEHITLKMWDWKNYYGQTPHEVSEAATRNDAWRNDPATEKQKEKLRYFGCTWNAGITKGQASNAIEECVMKFPQVEADYYNRPATPEQLAKLSLCLRSEGTTPDDYAAPGKLITYGEAKDLILEHELDERAEREQKEFDELAAEYSIDVGMWSELYPGLTWKRVQTAAKALDESQPGWRGATNHIDIMLARLAELNPRLLERWKKSGAPSLKV
jgi:ankyrin repeat protein